MIVTVSAWSSIMGGDVCFSGPWKEAVADFPLSAVACVAEDRRTVNGERAREAAFVARERVREVLDLCRSGRETRRRGDARQHRRDG